MEILSLIPRYPNIALEEADEHVRDPELGNTTYPFGPSSRQSKTAAAGDGAGPSKPSNKEAKKGTIPVHSSQMRKYGPGRVPSGVIKIAGGNFPLVKQLTRKKWKKAYFNVGSRALAASTWKSYTAAFHMFEKFCKKLHVDARWPLSGKVINSFIIWCGSARKLSAGTIKLYIAGLKTIGALLGFGRVIRGGGAEKLILKGLENQGARHGSTRKTSEPSRFEILKEVRKQLKTKFWNRVDKKAVWACCCVAYFGSFRAGEILAKGRKTFDRKGNFTWHQLTRLKGGGKVVHIVFPKTGQKGGGGNGFPCSNAPRKGFAH